jgi:hypothetical protein
MCDDSEKIFFEQVCKCPDHSSPEENETCQKKSWKFNPSFRNEYPEIESPEVWKINPSVRYLLGLQQLKMILMRKSQKS